ncbi:hypothetical protein NQ314_004703 [Rhamnusium bicolor]|uniref:Conserved oligomeric Golgi complex subunit 1 n=1 Tax=Rhamnusium bicolor TaxID=1586634 RepID=A0AAV8ZIR3_9CUCU|nr:hypothetical protein NQ314_004703 [Rhamnusium bicolor]
MSRIKSELLKLDVNKLFEERSIDEIIEIEKLLDVEIERKLSELRSMVGDRYKDVLAASDAIISMKTISQEIVNSIELITNICEDLITSPVSADAKDYFETDKTKIDERTLIIQIRLAIFMNEQIWIALDEENNLDAAQYYLLAQHIHTGLSLSKKEYLDKLPLLHQIRSNLVVLKSKIFQKITEKLESVEITAQETSSNLNALMLLENQSCDDLLSIFIEHRKTALNTVINTPYSSVRVQISAMVRCLITTVHLIHDCFICTDNGEKGLIWQQLNEIIIDSSPTTLSKLELPVTPLILYIPEIIRQFRPKCKSSNNLETSLKDAKNVLEKWLRSSQDTVERGLDKFLQLVTNIKGLHLIREESLKIGLSMKTKGYSQNVVELCEKMDSKYLDLLEDVSQYLYGKEYTSDINFSVVLKDFKFKRKYIDKIELEDHLRSECTNNSTHKTSYVLWQNWVSDSVNQTKNDVEKLNDITPSNMIKLLSRWDEIEIQEQTEEKVFKSQIKVPLKPNLALDNILLNLNNSLNCILPHTLPKQIHLQFIELNIGVILNQYKKLLDKELNQIQALQFLFDVKFLTTLCIPRENVQLVSRSQEICDKLRSRIDPFDLDMILGCLIPSSGQLASIGVSEKNKEQEKAPSILALSTPSSSSWFPLLPITVPSQKTSGMSTSKKSTKVGDYNKTKPDAIPPGIPEFENRREENRITTIPWSAVSSDLSPIENDSNQKSAKATPKRSQDPTTVMKQSAASLFGGLTTDWFS